MKNKYKIIALSLFILAIFLRVSLCLLNPPENSFDDHFQPISLIMQYGTIPAKHACWECFQPPIYYLVSAGIGRASFDMGANRHQVKKILQFICCFYGILTIGIIYLILNKLSLSDFSKLIAFGLVCFLPRHIYMSAIHSNDTMSYLFMALVIYLLIIATERNFSFLSLLPLSLVMTITLFIKYNTLVIIPIAVIAFALAIPNIPKAGRNKKIVLCCLALALPLSFLGTYIFSNVKQYGKALPVNYEIVHNVIESQPRGEVRVSFANFKPWESIKMPILTPNQLSSFWTIIYSGMWFDTEPKFLCFMDSNTAWWRQYFAWANGLRRYPGDNPSMSRLTLLEGSSLITLGLFPLILGIIGCFQYYCRLRNFLDKANWIEVAKLSIFPVLLITNAAGIITLTLRLPYYSAMKASYFLISLPAFAILVALGIMACENRPTLKRAIAIIFGTSFILVFWHILHISAFLYRLKIS